MEKNTTIGKETSSSAIDRTFLGEFKSIKSSCRNGTFRGEVAKFVPSLNGFIFVWMAIGNAELAGWNEGKDEEVEAAKKWPTQLLLLEIDWTGVGGEENIDSKCCCDVPVVEEDVEGKQKGCEELK